MMETTKDPKVARTDASSTSAARLGLSLVTLHIARCDAYPHGNSKCGYQVLMPLDEAGRLDPDLWRQMRAACLARRFREGDEDLIGRLVHRVGGRLGAAWCLDYRDDSPTAEEEVTCWEGHRFRVGAFVTIGSALEAARTFRIAQVMKIDAPARRPLSPVASATADGTPETVAAAS